MCFMVRTYLTQRRRVLGGCGFSHPQITQITQILGAGIGFISPRRHEGQKVLGAWLRGLSTDYTDYIFWERGRVYCHGYTEHTEGMARLFMKFHVFHGSGLFNAEAQSFGGGCGFRITDYTDTQILGGKGSGLFHHEGTEGHEGFGAWLGVFIHRLQVCG